MCSSDLKYHHDNIKYLPTINERNSTPGTIYKPSHEEEGNPSIPSKRSTDLSLSLTMVDKTIGGCVRTPRPDAFCRWNDWIKNIYWLRSCIHPFWQLRGSSGTSGLNTYELLLLLVQGLPEFKWSNPIKVDLAKKDQIWWCLPQETWKHYARVLTFSLLDGKPDKGQTPPIVYP